MKIGLIGIGRMGRVLAGLLAGQVDLVIYDRNIEKMKKAADELNVSIGDSFEEMADLGIIILALPDQEVVNCIRIFNSINKNVNVINIATNASQDMLNSIADSHVSCICAKFVGHAGEIASGHSPVIIVNPFPVALVGKTVEIFQFVGQVIIGEADIVYTINTVAAQKAIEASVAIEEALQQKGITDPGIIKSAIGQVAAGVMKSYAEGNLGPFAREILQSVKHENEAESL